MDSKLKRFGIILSYHLIKGYRKFPHPHYSNRYILPFNRLVFLYLAKRTKHSEQKYANFEEANNKELFQNENEIATRNVGSC